MTNAEVMDHVPQGYRMPKPTNMYVANETYEIMLQCWHNTPEKRPTFETIFNVFDDYIVSTESSYRESDD